MPLKRPDPSEPAKKKRAKPQPKQVGSLFGLVDRSNPFAGLGEPGAGAPAKTTKRPNLTELAAQAAARRTRLTPGTGGLLPAAQGKAERLASAIVETRTRFATPPPEASTAPPPRRSLQAAPPRSPARPAGRNIVIGGTRGGGGLSGLLGDIWDAGNRPLVGRDASAWVGKNVLGPAAIAGDKAVATGLRDTLAKFTGIGGPSIIEDFTHPTRALNESRKQGWQTSQEVLGNISRYDMKRPDISIPRNALQFEGQAYAAGPQNARIPFKDIAGQTGWSLKPEYTAKLRKTARDVQGWNDSDLDGLSATDLIYRAYNKPPGLLTRLAKGVASDVVMGGSQTVGVAGLLSEAAQGRGAQAAEDLGSSLKSITPGLSGHPVGDTLLTHPLFAATALHGGVKSAGAIGHLRPGARPVREVTLPVGEGETITRGRQSKNYVTAAGEALSDARLRRSPRAAAKVLEKDIDEHVHNRRDLFAHEHIPKQAAYKAAARNLKDDRKTELMAWQDFGGETGLRNGLEHFASEARNGNKAGERLLPTIQAALERPPTTPDDLAFVEGLKEISAHTSDVRQNLGLHGAQAQRFRQYETPIEMAASRGDPLAVTAKAARDNLEELQNRGDTGASKAKAAKVAEVERDVGRHTKKAAAAEKTIAKQRKALEEWKAEDAAINARRPKLEPLPKAELETTHATLKEASAAAKETPGAKVQKQDDGTFKITRPEGEAPKHPPGTMGPHRKAVAAWKAEKKAHAAKKPKVTGVSRAGGRIAAHETEVSQQGRRLDRLTQAEREALPFDEQVDLARNEYEHATQAFIDSHHAAGGAEPSRIARTKVKSGIAHPSRLAGKHRFTPKMQREYRSSGRSVTSGEYIYDPKAPLHENAEIQRIRQHVGIWNDLAQHPMVHHTVGDGETTVVGPGQVAVPVDNFRSAAKTAPRWDDNTPVSAHEVDRENTIRQKAADWMKGVSATEGEVIPRGEEVFLLPAAMHDRIIDWAKPVASGDRNSVMARYDRANKAYQRILIGIYPSTWLGNAPGSIPLAISSGAIPGRGAFKMAAKSGSTKGPIARAISADPTISPASVSGVGVAGSSMGRAENPVMQYVGFGRELSMKGEDFSARAAWFGQAKPVVEGWLPKSRKMFPAIEKMMPESRKGLAHQLDKDATEVYRALASGKWEDGARLSPELAEARTRMLDHVSEFMSASVKPQGDIGKAIGRVLLFHNWLGHILKLTMVSLPLHHPRRATLLNAISVYGNQYRQERGVYPTWMAQFLPVMRSQMDIGNGKTAPGILSAGTGQLTPLASGTSLAGAGTQLDTGSPLALGAGLTSPLIRPFLQAAIAMHDNSKLRPGEPGRVDPTGVLLAGIQQAIPGSAKFVPRSGYRPDANFFTGMKKKQYFEYVPNPSGKGYKRYEVPWSMRPGGRPLGGILGDASRVIGLPLEWNPTGGSIPLKVEQGNAQTIQSVNEVKRELKAAKSGK